MKNRRLMSAISWDASPGKCCYTHECVWSICTPHWWSSSGNIWNRICYVRHYLARLMPILLARCRHSNFQRGLGILFLLSNLPLMTPKSLCQTFTIPAPGISMLRRWLAAKQRYRLIPPQWTQNMKPHDMAFMQSLRHKTDVAEGSSRTCYHARVVEALIEKAETKSRHHTSITKSVRVFVLLCRL
jgi:hypothetical protein